MRPRGVRERARAGGAPTGSAVCGGPESGVAWWYCQIMSQSAADNWVLDEAEALLDTDGRRERLERVVAGLQDGKVQLVGHAGARERIEKRIRDRRRR